MGIMPTEMELILEQTQQGVCHEVSVTPAKHGRMTKRYSSPRFIANCFNVGYLKMEVKRRSVKVKELQEICIIKAFQAIKSRKKNQKKKSHTAAKENQGKHKAKMGYVPVQAPPFAPKLKNPLTPKKDNPAKDAICHQCGYGTHICITTQGLRISRKLKPGALNLYVGDGHRAAVKAIGDYHLCLPSGLVSILHNCHYVSPPDNGRNSGMQHNDQS
nr:hypothetical protein [Tanacetum cinerariifolium]